MASEVSLQSLLDKRRICRMRFTKCHKSVSKFLEQSEQLRSSGASTEDIELSIGATSMDMQHLDKIFNELQEVQDEIEFNPENTDRLDKMDEESKQKEENSEQTTRELYLSLRAKVQRLECKIESHPSSRRSSVASDISQISRKSDEQFSSKMLTESLTEAFKSINTGLTGDQMSQIVATMTKKKRDITVPKFKGESDLFDQWKDLVTAELEKPGYSEAEKSHFVISVLEGEALKVALSLKNPSYEELLHVLENKYGDVLVRVQQVIIKMANINPTNSANAKDLDALYAKLVTCWNYLLRKTDNDESFINSSWVLTALVRPKIPRTLVRRWDGEQIKTERSGRENNRKLPIKFDELLQKLKEALQVAWRTDIEAKAENYKNKHKEKYNNTNDRRKPTGHALSVTNNSASHKERTLDSCLFCGKRHASARCYAARNMTIPQRTERVKESKACFNCLKADHFVTSCKVPPCDKCGRKHHVLLHIEKRQNRKEYPQNEFNLSTPNDIETHQVEMTDRRIESSAGLIRAINGPKEILMQSGIVAVESNACVTQARVLFDSGSGVSFISKKMAKRLGLRGRMVEGEFTLAGGQTMRLKTQEVRFYLSSALPQWKGEVFEIVAYVIDKPSADLKEITVDLSKMPYLKGLQLADSYPRTTKSEVDIMLGIEDTLNIQMEEKIYGPRGMPTAQKTHIGWVLSGPCTVSVAGKSAYQVNRVSLDIGREEEIAAKHWELEHIGILPTENKGLKPLETEANRQYEEKTKYDDYRYETGLIRHPDWANGTLIPNRHVALSRLKAIERKLQQNPELDHLYESQLQELLVSGRAEKVDTHKDSKKGNIWYLPHHPVIRMDKTTTKVRIVFDGSAKGYDGISLNDTLLPGPPLQPDLLGVLIRFRKHKVALVADIEKMFLQIQMNPEDQDLQRFLWRNLNTDKPPDEYRLKTVTFGLKCSPFLSIKTIFKHIESEKDSAPTAAKEIRKNIFVDDILTGAENEEKAAELSIEMKQLLKRGGFPLRKFVSNKPKALKRLNPEDLATYHTVTMAASESSTTALGVKYLPKEDVLMFSFYEKLDNVDVETRRTFLKQLHRIYDPMGLLAPFTLIAKQLFQRAWTSTCEWDQPLPHELVQEWNTWKDQVPVLDQIKVNRCYVPEHFKKSRYTLHAFGDACEASYGAVVYIRVEDVANSTINVANVCAKTRVAPLKTRRSLPELELTASLLAGRLVRYVEREIDLPIESVFCWSDSRVAIEWISQPSYIWQTFVANRVAEIQSLVEPSRWKHIAGKNNPADLCTRGCNARTLVQSVLWWNGPEFLQRDASSWPKQENVSNKSATDTANKKRKPKNVTAVTLSVNRTDNQLVDYVNKFSSYNKFIGVFTRVGSWLKKHRSKIEGSYTGNPTEFQSIQHRQEEEIFWIKWAQLSAYHEEIDTLKAAKLLPKSSKLAPLDPFWDKEQQLLRVGGRLQNSVLPEETRNPIILPSHNYLTDLLVMYYHTTNCHSGVVQTLAAMRCKYWLIRGRQEIRRIIHNKCRVCKELSPLNQKIAPLPADRVREAPPFTHVGVDFAGPLYVRVDKEQNKKAYITLFTCMITRAVHLELVPDMTTNEFLRALERMINRRGKCSIIYSDNAKTFKKASKLLFQIFDDNPVNKRQIEDGLTGKGIKWKFITEHAPWHGGFYERMVKSVKMPLKKVLGKARLTYTEMETVLTDIEAQIYLRPLTDVSADKEDPLPLTPGHLVIGRHLRILPDIPMKVRQTSLGKRWNYQQRLSKQFWNRWNKEYLLELNKLQKWTEIKDNLKVGDVVLIIAHDNMKKQEWILEKVVETHPGRDELVRSVTLKTASGLVRRPIQRLRLLEAPETETECK